MRRFSPTLFGLVESFFRQYLQEARGVSPHTIRAYRDALRLFLEFLAQRISKNVDRLDLTEITSTRVREFLTHLETEQGNCIATRNCRFAALRCWIRHLLRHDLEHSDQYSQILMLPTKRSRQSPPEYLEPEHVHLVLKEVKMSSRWGTRDAALLMFLYGTGARVGEALQVRWSDMRLERPPQVRLHGKGRKDRVCPLWTQTVALMRRLEQQNSPAPEDHVFLNKRGQPLTRDGVSYLLRRYYQRAQKKHSSLPTTGIHPHMLRHSCAMALMEAGIGLTSIRDYLGHSSIATTGRYLQTNIAIKNTVLRRFWKRSGLETTTSRRWRPTAGLLNFLEFL